MGELRCVDGSVLSVTAVACRDRAGQPYEITLTLARDSVPFASVGQRCGHQLATLAEQVTGARLDPGQAAAWPDPDDRFPAPSAGPEPGGRGGTHKGSYLPGETEYFALRSRDRGDLPGTGELRCLLRSSAVWVGDCAGTGGHGTSDVHARPGQPPWPHLPGKHGEHGLHAGEASQHLLPGQHVPPGQHMPAGQTGRGWPAVRQSAAGHGQWRLSRRAVIEAWGTSGIGVRAVLTSAELVAFLDTVLTGPESRVLAAAEAAVSQQTGRSGGSMPYWRQRGKVPDATSRTRLPALRAQARGGARAAGDPQARRGDVRR